MRYVLPLIATLAFVACTSVRSGEPATPAESKAAIGIAAQLASLEKLSTQPSSARLAIEATDFQTIATLVAPDLELTLPKNETILDGCLTATRRTATFTDCKAGGYALDGSLSTRGADLNAELNNVFILGDIEGATNVEATLARSNDLTGNFELYVSWNDSARDHVLDATLRADSLAVNNGCPVGGSLTITARYDHSPNLSRTFWYGPNCGDVVVAR